MTPSSCSTAPSSICCHVWRSNAWAMMARLRMRDVDMAVLRIWRGRPAGRDLVRSSWSGGGGKRFLLGEGAIDLVAHQLGQLPVQHRRGELPAQQFVLGGKRIARARNIDRHDRLDAART